MSILIKSSFLLALMATLGSLYFGEVLKFPPCTLCWYQRICMYPLVVIFGSALWTGDEKYFRNSLPLSLLGLFIASYHNLLYYGLIPDSITPCSQGVSCTSKQVEIFGFLTIPLMAWISFLALSILGILALKASKKNLTEKQ